MIISREGTHQVARATRRRTRRGYAKSRVAYDRRRRADPPDHEARAFMAIVRKDPCAYCGGYCGQMAADHIVPANSGGLNTWDNYTAAGRACNAQKKDQPLLHYLLRRNHAEPH